MVLQLPLQPVAIQGSGDDLSELCDVVGGVDFVGREELGELSVGVSRRRRRTVGGDVGVSRAKCRSELEINVQAEVGNEAPPTLVLMSPEYVISQRWQSVVPVVIAA